MTDDKIIKFPNAMNPQKPRLVLLRGNAITAESLARNYEALIGRKPTAEQIEAARQRLAKAKDNRPIREKLVRLIATGKVKLDEDGSSVIITGIGKPPRKT
jgi:hypothetical protein